MNPVRPFKSKSIFIFKMCGKLLVKLVEYRIKGGLTG